MEERFATMLLLFAAITTPGFLLFYANQVTDIYVNENDVKLFYVKMDQMHFSKPA